MNFVRRLFEDKRLTSVFLMTWLLIVVVCFADLGVMRSSFISFGPSDHTFFMGIAIDSWRHWWWVAIFTFLSTAINDFVGDSIVPWIQNTVQDHKSRYLPYSKFTCWAITQTYSFYVCTMSVFSIFLLLSQLDFMIIRVVADFFVNMYTTYSFMRNKVVDPQMYDRWHGHTMHFDDCVAEDASVQGGHAKQGTAAGTGTADRDAEGLYMAHEVLAVVTDEYQRPGRTDSNSVPVAKAVAVREAAAAMVAAMASDAADAAVTHGPRGGTEQTRYYN